MDCFTYGRLDTKAEFLKRLHSVLTPSSPVDSIEFLFGRIKERDNIEEALYAKGRHCFIYGDRGVGKSSLAYTVANLIQSSDKPYIKINCSEESTFQSIMDMLIFEMSDDLEHSSKTISGAGEFSAGPISFGGEHTDSFTRSSLASRDIGAFASIFASRSALYSKKTAVVIDEFDTISNVDEKEKFGKLIKHLSNIDCNAKLIFTGIASSLTNLLGGHESSVRQIHQEHLGPLSWDGRFSIIDRAFEEFNLNLPDDIRFKIAGLSDGYPSYVHLICEKLLSVLYNKGFEKAITFQDFLLALDKAIDSIAEEIRRDYDKATLGRNDEFHHILWAMADSADQIRHSDHILDSYRAVCKTIRIEPMEPQAFTKQFKKLCGKSHGEIVMRGFSNRPKWWKFKESLVRGLIRMYAEKHGVVLDFERHYAPTSGHVSQKAWQREYRPLTTIEHQVSRIRKDTDK